MGDGAMTPDEYASVQPSERAAARERDARRPPDRSPGTTCGISPYRVGIDRPDPVEGDFLVSNGGSCYRIDHVHRAVSSRADCKVFALRCTRLERGAVELGGPGVHYLVWDDRG